MLDVIDLKTRLGIPFEDTSQDVLLGLILEDARAFFKDYCNREDVPDSAESVIARLAVVLYTRNADQYKQSMTIGAYSITNFASEGGDIPKSILKQLGKYKKGRTVVFR